MYNVGDVVLSVIPFTDSSQVKIRPAVILYEKHGNFVVAGVTSNERMDGVSLTQKEGLPFDSIIKTNYIFTITKIGIKRKLTQLSRVKRAELHTALTHHLEGLTD